MINDLRKKISKLALNMTSIKKFYYSIIPDNSKDANNITFHFISDLRTGCDTGNTYTEMKVQFNTFSSLKDNGELCNLLLDEIQTVIKGSDNTCGTSEIIDIRRDFIIPARWIDNMWFGTIQFTVIINNL